MDQSLHIIGGVALGGIVGILLAMHAFAAGARAAIRHMGPPPVRHSTHGSPETDMVADRDRLAAIQEGYKHEDNDLDDEE